MEEDAQPGRIETTWKQGAGLLALSGALTLVLFEVGLRVAGWSYLASQAQVRDATEVRPGSVRVMCVGESTTALGREGAYPVQLESILNERGDGPPVQVVNTGVPAVTSDYLVERVPGWLDAYQPRVVVAMMGVNDPLWERDTAFDRVVGSFRVVKLVRWAAVALRVGRLLQRDPQLDDIARALQVGELAQARDELAAAEATAPGLPEWQAVRAAEAERSGLPVTRDEAVAHALAGTSPEAHARLLDAFLLLHLRGAPRVEAEWLGQHVATDDPLWWKLQMQLYPTIDRLISGHRLDEAEEALAILGAFPPGLDDVGYDGRMATLAKARGDRTEYDARQRAVALRRAERVSPMTVRTYRALRDLLRQRGIPLVAVQYALRPVGPLEELLEHDPTVVFVSTEEPFRAAVAAASYGDYFTDLFAGDFGHKTARGNRLLAETIAAALVARGLLESPPAR